MFDHLTARLSRTLENLRGPRPDQGRERRRDAGARCASHCWKRTFALPVVKSFIESVRAKALGAEVLASLTPGQAFIGILHSELVQLMGGSGTTWKLRAQPPVVLLLAGLQGAGQDHHRGEAGALTCRARAQARAARQARRAPAGRDAAARASRRPGAGRVLRRQQRRGAGVDRARGVAAGEERVSTRLIVDTAGRCMR